MEHNDAPVLCYVEVGELLAHLREAELYALLADDYIGPGLVTAQQIITAYTAGRIDGSWP